MISVQTREIYYRSVLSNRFANARQHHHGTDDLGENAPRNKWSSCAFDSLNKKFAFITLLTYRYSRGRISCLVPCCNIELPFVGLGSHLPSLSHRHREKVCQHCVQFLHPTPVQVCCAISYHVAALTYALFRVGVAPTQLLDFFYRSRNLAVG